MTIRSLEDIKGFVDFVRKVAAQKRMDAAYGGFHSDHGASELETRLECWVNGIDGAIPKVLQSYYDEFQRDQDPEYKEYLRLQKKFKK